MKRPGAALWRQDAGKNGEGTMIVWSQCPAVELLDRTILTFTRLNWNIPRMVPASASQDDDMNHDVVTLTAAGGDYDSQTSRK